jgi:IS30 family transposase
MSAVTPEAESHNLQATLHNKPAAATHWSTRTLAEHLGLSVTTVRRVWRRNAIKPHVSRTFNTTTSATAQRRCSRRSPSCGDATFLRDAGR